MAVSILLQPQEIAPAYNPIVMVFSATSATTLNGFAYVVKIRDANTNEILNTKKLPPDLNGLGVFKIDNLLQVKVENQINPKLYGIVKNEKNNFEYNLDCSGEHYETWKFNGYFQNFISPEYSGFTTISSSISPAPWLKGDMITIKGNSTTTDGSYEVLTAGTFFGAYTIVLNRKHTPSTVYTGVTYLSNNKKTQIGGNSVGSFLAFNSALPLSEYKVFNSDIYKLDTSARGYFISSLPRTIDPKLMYPIELSSECVAQGWVPTVAETPNLVVNTYTNAGGNIGRYRIDGDGVSFGFMAFGIGTKNISNSPKTTIFGTTTIFNDNVSYYSVHAVDQSNFAISTEVFLKIKKECSKHIKYRIVFCDSYGSYIPFNFNYAAKRTININKKNVGRLIGSFNPLTNTYDIKTSDREKATIASTYSESVTVTSGWITENISDYLKELFVSNDAYLVDPETEDWIAINITNTTYDYKTDVRDRLFNITLSFTYSVTDRAQASI
jgi:hypothetical protein